MHKPRIYALALPIIMLGQAIGAIAQQSAQAAPFREPSLHIGAGDLLQVNVFEDPELSGQFRVDAHGDIGLPLVGRVHVAGDTADQVGTLVAKHYVEAGILKPESSYATVSIVEYATQGITVNGDVRNPGIYPALGVRMLNDVIAAAGGLLPTSASKVIITHRDDSEHPVDVTYNPGALTPQIPNVQIFPGDSILVPRAGIVYVLGDVNHSGGFILDGRQDMTIQEAIALADGTGKAAALKRVQVVRSLNDGRKEAMTVSIKDIYMGKAPDVVLHDGDVVYVPTSTGKLAAEQAITSALGVGTGVAVYRSAYH